MKKKMPIKDMTWGLEVESRMLDRELLQMSLTHSIKYNCSLISSVFESPEMWTDDYSGILSELKAMTGHRYSVCGEQTNIKLLRPSNAIYFIYLFISSLRLLIF